LLFNTTSLILLYPKNNKIQGEMAQENIMINDLFIQILSGIIIAAIIGAASSFFIMYKCIHKQARKINTANKAMALVLKLLVIDTRKNHPDSEYVTEIDKIYQDMIKDSD